MACLVAALVDLMMEKVEGEVVAVMEDSVPVEASEPWLINGDPSHRYPQPYVSETKKRKKKSELCFCQITI